MIQIKRKSDEDHWNFHNRSIFMLQRFFPVFTETRYIKADQALARQRGQLLTGDCRPIGKWEKSLVK